MRKVYAVIAGVLLAAAVAQMYFAAVGAFDKPQDDGSFALHSMTGMLIIPVLSLLATAAAAAARAPGPLIGRSLLPLGLVIVQVLIVVLGRAFDDDSGNSTPLSLAILGLHALNGMAVIGVSAAVFQRARKLAMSGDPGREDGPATQARPDGPAVPAS
ncbi:hypothetical protein JOL79_17150 [Microbispora sp. RL4-1S]|uniref:Cytochrome b561 domain-containing protein n=1 Tax=Microbispora oryzae TaxID=2806554 RepID=A0A940WHB9_9ACTN|nr:DUF6220 domain-containing protein [Microbispora oryzae]MBP2705541.1 hypothetical protein [Microbispora oryzae]